MEGQEITITIRKGTNQPGLFCQLDLDGTYVDSVEDQPTVAAALQRIEAKIRSLEVYVASDWSTKFRRK